MPSDRELRQRIRCRIADLTQAVVDAVFWPDRRLEQANDQRQHALAGLKATHQRTLAAAHHHMK
jgi:hypothetical protein